MKPVQLEFRSPAALASSGVAWSALLVAGVFAAVTGWHVARSSDELESLRARHDVLLARARPAPARADVVGPELARRIAAGNQVIDQLAVPWDALFRSIESADARGLGVMSLVPNARLRAIRLSGEARSVPDLLAYVDRLAALRTLDEVRLEGYETVLRDGVDVVSFTVAASWRLN
jgi:hypothetical protein